MYSRNLTDVLRAGGFVLIIQGIGIALSLSLQVMLARWLGASEYGVYVFSIAWVTIISIIFGLGLPVSSIRFISEGLVTKNWGYVRGFLRWSVVLAIVSAIIAVILGASVIELFGGSWSNGVYSTLYASMFCIPALSIMRINIGVFRGFGWAASAYWPEKLGRPILIILAIIGMQYADIKLTAETVVIATAIVLSALCATQLLTIKIRRPIEIYKARPQYDTKNWLKTSLPLVAVAGFQVVIDRTDIIVLGMFVETDAIAIYNAGARSAGLVIIILTAMNALSASKIATLYKSNDIEGLRILIKGILKWTFWPSLALTIAVVIFSENIMIIFGEEFREGKNVLVLLAVSQLINATAGPVMLLMNMTGNQTSTAFVLGVAAVTNLMLNLIFIPLWGVVGAAIATGLTIIVWNIWLTLIVKSRVGISCFVFSKS